MDDDLKHNLTAGETWIRGLFILLFAFFLVIARIVTGAVVVIQFLFTVFTGQTNDNLKNFGASLSRYVYQCLLFVTYNSDDKPFPFDEWPEAKLLAEVKTVTKTVKAKAAPRKKASPKKKATTKKKAKAEAKPEAETQPQAEAGPEEDTSSAPESPSGETGTKTES